MTVLSEVLKRVQDEHGSEAAVQLGMRLCCSSDVVVDLVLANVKGDAVNFQVANALLAVPDADKPRQLPRMITVAYKTVGRISLGLKPFSNKEKKQPKVQKSETDEQPKSKKNWPKKKGQGKQQQQKQESHPPSPADLLESKFLLTRDNHTNLVIRIIPGAVGFTYLTFNEGDTVPIAYKSHLYTSAEMRFSTVEKILTAVQMAIFKERALSQGKRMLVVTPYPSLEAVTRASVPNSKALHPRWIQWAASLTSLDVTFLFDASLQSQEFLLYEFVHTAPLTMRPLEEFNCIIYTDGSAQVAHRSKHAYVFACAIVVGTIVNDEFKSEVVHTQTLGDCTAQLAELRALMLALEYADRSVTTLIVSDSYYCVQSYNDNLHFWIQNDFRDSKGSTIKHKMIWVRVAELKERLSLVFVIHTLGHQRVGVHAVGNSLADEAAKSAVSSCLVAAVTRSKGKIDDDILAAVAATEKGGKYPKGFPSKYTYHLSPDKVPYVKIPDVGKRLVPNTDRRHALISAAHEGVASAHAGVSATAAQLQLRFCLLFVNLASPEAEPLPYKKADKGGALVIIDTVFYETKVLAHVNDETTFRANFYSKVS
ncbi:uncharacterized protein LOC144826163 [Lissotriton helveticus]